MRFDDNRMFANDEPAASRAPRPERLGSLGEAVQLTAVFALMVVSAVALAIGMVEGSASVWIGGHVARLASLLVADGTAIKVVSERLGHAHPAFTMHTYQHLLPGMSGAAAERFATLVATANR